MDVMKVKIKNKIFDVVPYSTYASNTNLYNTSNYAVDGNDGYIYPIRPLTASQDTPGFYTNNLIGFYVPGDEETYSVNNIIDFNNVKSMQDMKNKIESLKDLEKEILTDADNIFSPIIDYQQDTAEMRALKEAVNAKHIDINKYESRFGPSFGNDKRLFKRNSITMDKLKDIANALDMKVVLTIEDRNKNVPNPMCTVISTEITSSGGESNGE